MSKDEFEEEQLASDFGSPPKTLTAFEPEDHEQAVRILSLDYALAVFPNDNKQRSLPQIAVEIERYLKTGAVLGQALQVVK